MSIGLQYLLISSTLHLCRGGRCDGTTTNTAAIANNTLGERNVFHRWGWLEVWIGGFDGVFGCTAAVETFRRIPNTTTTMITLRPLDWATWGGRRQWRWRCDRRSKCLHRLLRRMWVLREEGEGRPGCSGECAMAVHYCCCCCCCCCCLLLGCTKQCIMSSILWELDVGRQLLAT
jgi:hypothetical protein